MKRVDQQFRSRILLVGVASLLLATACSTPTPDNTKSRPRAKVIGHGSSAGSSWAGVGVPGHGPKSGSSSPDSEAAELGAGDR
jgi:hypothetical protein